MKYPVNLSEIKSPEDIKKFDLVQLRELAAEMRSALIRKLSVHGGHVGPNLGVVEATIALHYVFNAPEDKIVFDVSHQSYPHKMLTGRMEAFVDPEHYNDVTGYTNPHESPAYDLFEVGHTSTSLSLAGGLAKARDLEGKKYNVVALIGDASLGGGMALEGLDFDATLGSNMIIVVNDNNMSIAENHGALYAQLRMLRNTNGTGQPNFFESLGYDYRYVHYGNDLRSLIEAFQSVKDINHPVIVHINTMKGMGLPVAEAEKEKFHWTMPFNPKTGAELEEYPADGEPLDYGDIFADMTLGMMAEGKNITVVTAGTPGSIGYSPERRKAAGDRFIDVGICEQQAVGMCAGMAKNGLKPVMGVCATFLQRAYDQLNHDVAINDLPAVFCVFATGLWSIPDVTHLGIFDIPVFSNIPQIEYLTPVCTEEFKSMLEWAVNEKSSPVMIRVPGGKVRSYPELKLAADYSRPEYMIDRASDRLAIIAVGNTFGIALKAREILKEKGIVPTLINPRQVSTLDTAALDTLAEYSLVITLEDSVLDGGYGQKVAAHLGMAPVEVKCIGLKKEYIDNYSYREIAEKSSLTPEKVAEIALASFPELS